jgi:hypothetical protein
LPPLPIDDLHICSAGFLDLHICSLLTLTVAAFAGVAAATWRWSPLLALTWAPVSSHLHDCAAPLRRAGAGRDIEDTASRAVDICLNGTTCTIANPT